MANLQNKIIKIICQTLLINQKQVTVTRAAQSSQTRAIVHLLSILKNQDSKSYFQSNSIKVELHVQQENLFTRTNMRPAPQSFIKNLSNFASKNKLAKSSKDMDQSVSIHPSNTPYCSFTSPICFISAVISNIQSYPSNSKVSQFSSRYSQEESI
jgi:hypothetical protein